MANEFVAKNGLISQNNTVVSGSLTVTQGITGSLFGTASYISPTFISASAAASGFGSGGGGGITVGTTTITSGTSGRIAFNNAGVYGESANLFWNNTNSNLGIGVTSPTAKVHIGAGTATANTSPLKLTAGTNLTTPESGSIEYNGTNLFLTPSSSTRNILAQISGSTALTTGQIPFASSPNGYLTGSGNLFWNNTNGRLGLGGIAPNYDFSIMKNATGTFVGMQISNNSSGTTVSDGLLIGIGSDNHARVETQDANNIIISSNSTGKLQVTTSGTQFFGTLSNLSVGSINTGAIFQVNGNASTSGLGFIQFRDNSGTPVLCASETGKVIINLSVVGTAQLTIGAGTATAGTAPLKLTSGTNLTTPEAGTVEYNNTFHLTNSDTTRRHIVTAPNTTKVTAGAPFANDGYIIVNIGGTDFKLMTTA